jgi:predicted acylesterase/phospholipase RssA
VALVCAGGGVTGAVYEIGCLRALEDLLDRSVLDFDLYVGISGGAFVTSLLAHGLSPREIYDQVVMRSPRPEGVSPASLFRLGLGDLVTRTRRAPRALRDALGVALSGQGRSVYDMLVPLFELLPSGILDNSGIHDYLSALFRSRGHSDRFEDLARELYLVAVDLDNGETLAFGERNHRDVTVSKAVQASTALPGLYRPVRIGGRDYVDGGVRKTAHINLAIRHGADLVICINPIVPYLNNTLGGPFHGHLSSKGLTYVLDQAFRIVLHGRMEYGMQRYAREHPEVDILLIEPTRDDIRMFAYNIMRFDVRQVVAEDGYRSVLAATRRHRAAYGRMLARHGIGLRNPASLPELPPVQPHRTSLARRLDAALDRLGSQLREIEAD